VICVVKSHQRLGYSECGWGVEILIYSVHAVVCLFTPLNPCFSLSENQSFVVRGVFVQSLYITSLS